MKRYTIYLFIESIPEKKVFNATITLLTVTENLCHKWPCICSICCNHSPVLFSFMTYHWVCSKSNTTCATCGAGTLYPSRAQRFTPGFQWGLIYSFLYCALKVILCPFVLFSLAIVLSVLPGFTASEYCFGIFNPFHDVGNG